MKRRIPSKITGLIFCLFAALSAVSCSRQDEKKLISGPDDYNGKILCSQLGTIYEVKLPSMYPGSQLFLVDGYIDPIVMIQKGRADVAFLPEFQWNTIKEEYPELMNVESPFQPTDIAFAISKDKAELKEKLNRFIKECKGRPQFMESLLARPLSYEDVLEINKKRHGSGKLTVAISATQEPFEYFQDGAFLGAEPDLLRAFAEMNDMDCEFIDMNFPALIPYITTGKADIAIGMISVTEERKQSVDFCEPWIQEKYTCVIRKADYAGEGELLIEDFNDVEGKRIAVLTGSCQDNYLSNSGIDCEIVRFESVTDMYLALKLGKVDGLLTSSISQMTEKKAAPFAVCVCDTIRPLPVGVAFNKNESALKNEFNRFLNAYMSTDKYKERYEAWLDDPNSCDFDRSPYPITNGSITAGVSAILPPFCFIKDGQVTGFEVELIHEFAKSTGRKLELMDISFPALIPFVASGKGQIAACSMCITEERKQGADFSDPWLLECTTLITKHASHSAKSEDANIWQGIKNSFYKNVIKEKRYLMLLDGLNMTILISLLSALFGTMFGALLCLGYRSERKVIKKTCRLFVDFMRCMPQVVFLMIMFYIVLGQTDLGGPTVAIISFAMCFGAYTCIIFSSTADSLDKGQREAAWAMGFSKFKTFRFFTLPQLVQKALPVYQNEFIGLVKATSIVGYIAVADLTRAGDIIRSRTYEAFFPLIIVTIIYFLIIWVLSFILKYISLKTQPKRNTYHK